jgi:sialate O-acetylesterase
LVREGANVIAIRVFDHFGDGGLMGPAANLSVESAVMPGKPVALSGRWQWAVERTIPKVPATIFADAPAIPPHLNPQNQIAALYNGMIAPIIPYGLRGFIWYQGEANVATHQTYQSHFSAMIRDWRTRWGEGTLPFYFVQLASFTESPDWPYLREAQTATLSEPRTGMAVAIDVGTAHDIHPTDKQTVGRRLAAIAFADSYGIQRESSGPSVETVEMRGSAAIVKFHHGEGLRTHDRATHVRGFALAGSDHAYCPADARIEKDTVVVTCAAVAKPVTVRYAWADYIEVNLENSAGVPAIPFRTDGD